MAFRANQTFFVGDSQKRRRMFAKDSVVPDDVAKGREGLVYDDGATVKRGPGRPRKSEAVAVD